jgi:hypothetical protein
MVAGRDSEIVVEMEDGKGNPTAAAATLKWCTDGDRNCESNSVNLENSEGTMKHTLNVEKSGDYELEVKLDSASGVLATTRAKVEPAAPDIGVSTHIFDLQARKIRSDLNSRKDTTLTLQVDPKDEFENAVLEADGFAVEIFERGREGDLGGRLIAADGFKKLLTFPADYETTIEVTYLLDGVAMDPGTYTIEVGPTTDHTIAYVIASVLLVAIGVLGIMYKRRVKLAKKTEVSTDGRERIARVSNPPASPARAGWSEHRAASAVGEARRRAQASGAAAERERGAGGEAEAAPAH